MLKTGCARRCTSILVPKAFLPELLPTPFHFDHGLTPRPLSASLQPHDQKSMVQLQEKVIRVTCRCLWLWIPGLLVLPCLRSGSCRCCTQGCTAPVSLLWASCGLLGTESSSSVRATSSSFISMCDVVSQADIEARNAPYHPMRGG